MEVVIPAGGQGSRISAINPKGLPKILMPYGKIPLIEHILETVRNSTEFLGEVILTIKQSQYDVLAKYIKGRALRHKVRLIVEPDGRLGFGGGVKAAERALGNKKFLIMASDGIFYLPPFMGRSESTVFSAVVDDPENGGVITTDGDGHVTRIVEKPVNPESNRIVAGAFYVYNPDLFWQCLNEIIDEDRRQAGEYQLTGVIQSMIDKGEKIGYWDIRCVRRVSKTFVETPLANV